MFLKGLEDLKEAKVAVWCVILGAVTNSMGVVNELNVMVSAD